MLLSLVGVLTILQLGSCEIDLTIRDYLKVPADMAGTEFNIFNGAAFHAAYDAKYRNMYIVGDSTNILHIVDMNELIHGGASSPSVFRHKKQFDTSADGYVLDVAICGDIVAFAFKDRYPAKEGYVELYHLLEPLDTDLRLNEKIIVGVYPHHLKFTSNCDRLLVANEGRTGFDGFPEDPVTKFRDPEGSVTIIDIIWPATKHQRLSLSTVEFKEYNTKSHITQFLEEGGRYVWRGDHQAGVEYTNMLSQDLEPEHITITDDDRFAYVTLQSNNAIAKISLGAQGLSPGLQWIRGLGKKDWNQYGIDATDLDGGINFGSYNLKSFYMPGKTNFLLVNNVEYLITMDEGRERVMSESGVSFSDMARAKQLHDVGFIDQRIVDALTFAQTGNNTVLGRLLIGANDGVDCIYRTMGEINGFGGRGFSMWRDMGLGNLQQHYNSGDDIERQLATHYSQVFNSKAFNKNHHPTDDVDSQSPDMGPRLSAMASGDLGGTQVLLMGDSNSNAIFIYSFVGDFPRFEGVHRAGRIDLSWIDLYRAGRDAGDVGISDMGFISGVNSPTGQPLLYVIGGSSGTFALYDVTRV